MLQTGRNLSSMELLGNSVDKVRPGFIVDSSSPEILSGAAPDAANGDQRQGRRGGSIMNEQGDVQIDIERLGPEPETIEEVSRAALEHPSAQEYLDETRNRLLGFELLEPRLEDKADGLVPQDRYRATTYDYTNNRVVLTTGRLDDPRGSIEISEAGYQ